MRKISKGMTFSMLIMNIKSCYSGVEGVSDSANYNIFFLSMQSFEALSITGLKGFLIFLDIDGTLINDNAADLTEETLRKIHRLEANNQVYLCSNSPNRERNLEVAAQTGLEYIDTNLRKPSRKILELVDHSPFKDKLVIGDKFFTDGLFARNIKATFIKVKRLESPHDRLHVKFLYWIDDLASRIIRL